MPQQQNKVEGLKLFEIIVRFFSKYVIKPLGSVFLSTLIYFELHLTWSMEIKYCAAHLLRSDGLFC